MLDSQLDILVYPIDLQALFEALIQAKNWVWNAEKIRMKIVDGFELKKWAATIIQLMDTVSE